LYRPCERSAFERHFASKRPFFGRSNATKPR